MVLGLAADAGAQVRIDERVEVRRVLVDVRVTDSAGRPIRGLSKEDFRVDLDGRSAPIEWVQWVGTGAPPGTRTTPAPAESSVAAGPGAAARHDSPTPAPDRGRLLVFFLQKDMTHGRVEGMLRLMRESAAFVDSLGPADRAAVVVYDSRLRVWQDFTSDRERLRDVLGRGILADPPLPRTEEGASLVASADADRFRSAHGPEMALAALAGALGRIEGAKSLVMLGYGFGEFRPFPGILGRAELDESYHRARQALIDARVSVFALDITQADAHTLETSLMTVSEETGGFYARTDTFPAAAMNRLAGALEGYYVLAVDTADVKPRKGEHHIHVGVSTSGATVSARRYYRD